MIFSLILLAAVLMDRVAGEPRRWHPLVGFGRLANWVEARLHPGQDRSTRLRGVIGWLGLVLPPTLLAAWLAALPGIGVLLSAVMLYLAIGARSLAEHAEAVVTALIAGDLPLARERVGWIVSRDTDALDERGIARATVESVLENGSDAVFAAIFWFLLLGAPGVVLYRLANTLDAMWGYRTPRYRDFGWAAARFDDVLNFLPARLTALSYALLGNTRSALHCWRTQARHWYSPNAGPVMAAGAGALEVRIGGAAIYHGQMKERPVLGQGRAPVADDIHRAMQLVQRGTWLWVLLALVWSVLDA